jgi:tetratricopeptide (TPR) repeat protein
MIGRERITIPKVHPSWLLPGLIALAVVAVFSPALQNQFLDWDDTFNFVENHFYRGLGWAQLRWMWTESSRTGHYIPLTWMTLGLDYAVWGLNPFGYHLTNILLHGANAVCFYFVSRRLLTLASVGADERRLDAAAVFSALFFALHPLRVESVAWATERRDVLCGLFYLLSILFYLRRRLGVSAAFYAASLLSKSLGIALPVILVILDVYPLRRLPGDSRRWFSSDIRPVWREKLPYLLAALPAAVMVVVASSQFKALVGLDEVNLTRRLALGAYSSAFYLWKTLVPLDLIPLYETPIPLDPIHWPFLLSGAVLAILTAFFYCARHMIPAGLAAWTAYAVTLAPVAGFVTVAGYLAADRYTYLPCLGFAVLFAGILLKFDSSELAPRRVVPTTAVAILAALGILSWRQTKLWHDTETLWRHTLTVAPKCSIAHRALGSILSAQGKPGESIEHYRAILAVRSDSAEKIHNDWGIALVQLGKFDEAIEHYREALRLKPELPDAHHNIGIALIRTGKLDEAASHFREALKLKPGLSQSHINWGIILAAQGRLEEAVGHYREAIRIDPAMALTHHNLGLALVRLGKPKEAIAHFREALRLQPDYPDAAHSLKLTIIGLRPHSSMDRAPATATGP